MSPRRLARFLGIYALALAFICVVIHGTFALSVDEAHPVSVIASVWQHGQLVERAVLPSSSASDSRLDAAKALPGATLVHEAVVGEGPILTRPEAAFALSIVSGHDGVTATLGGAKAYVTPDDLLARQAYDHGVTIDALTLTLGVDVPAVLALLADRLHTSVPDVLDHARIRRIRTVRSVAAQAPPGADPKAGETPSTIRPEALTKDVVRAALLDGARYLAHGVHDDGRLRYLVDAPSNRDLSGYDWPRHAGATYFLAQAAAIAHEPELSLACLRAASYLRDHALVTCGINKCIGDAARVDIGSSALAAIAFVEIASTGLDPTYAPIVTDLAKFIRSQQRGDGEFMHEFDRDARVPVDVQYVYYSGEASLALARAHGLTHDPADLDAASRGLAHLIGPAWSFFGDRYYFGEEHWTCQAMADLWDRAPDAQALDFCVRWQRWGRRLMHSDGETVYDADGSYGVGPIVTPRLTPVASRCEAGVATLDVLRRVGGSTSEATQLDAQLRRSLALLLRHQLRPGPAYLFADPEAVFGAMPGSEVDLGLRIDYVQHAGSAMVRWLSLP